MEPQGNADRGPAESRGGSKPLLSVVVPVYCEESGIGEFYARTKAMLVGLQANYDHEILFVNDGSSDHSLEILADMARRDPCVRVISFSRNFGHQFAITAGIDGAAGDAVVIIDSDLQDPPEIIPRMLAKWEEGYKVVYGLRTKREGESRFKLVTASLYYRFMQTLSDTKIPLDAGDFRLVDRAVADVIRRMREEHRYMRGMMAWAGFPQFGLEYERDERYAGETKYNLRKMIRLALDGIVSFSPKPLFLAGYLGTAVTGGSLLLIVWLVISRLFGLGTVVTGWSSLLAVMLFLGGVQLMSLGILGQYVGRTFEQSKQRPLYIVSQTYNFRPRPLSAPLIPASASEPPAADRSSS